MELVLQDFVRWQQSLEKKIEGSDKRINMPIYQIWKRVDAHLTLTSILDASLIRERWLLQAQKEKAPGTLRSYLGILIFSPVKYVYF